MPEEISCPRGNVVAADAGLLVDGRDQRRAGARRLNHDIGAACGHDGQAHDGGIQPRGGCHLGSFRSLEGFRVGASRMRCPTRSGAARSGCEDDAFHDRRGGGQNASKSAPSVGDTEIATTTPSTSSRIARTRSLPRRPMNGPGGSATVKSSAAGWPSLQLHVAVQLGDSRTSRTWAVRPSRLTGPAPARP